LKVSGPDLTYSILVRELFGHPAHIGTLREGPGVVVGEAGNIERGAWIRFHVRIDGGRVTDARFRAYGCPHTLAAAEWICRSVQGKSVTEASAVSAVRVQEALEAPAEKLGRLLIVEDALRACLR
jgi:NifU-like protein involved in Fe-S cluster formation